MRKKKKKPYWAEDAFILKTFLMDRSDVPPPFSVQGNVAIVGQVEEREMMIGQRKSDYGSLLER